MSDAGDDPFSCVPPPMSPDSPGGADEDEDEDDRDGFRAAAGGEDGLESDEDVRDLRDRLSPSLDLEGTLPDGRGISPSPPPPEPASPGSDPVGSRRNVPANGGPPALLETPPPSSPEAGEGTAAQLVGVNESENVQEGDGEFNAFSDAAATVNLELREGALRELNGEDGEDTTRTEKGGSASGEADVIEICDAVQAKHESLVESLAEGEDDFGDFSEIAAVNGKEGKEESPTESHHWGKDSMEKEEEDFGDFADFSSGHQSIAQEPKASSSTAVKASQPTLPLRTLCGLFSFEGPHSPSSTSASPGRGRSALPSSSDTDADFSDDLWTRLNPAAPPSSSDQSSSSSASSFGPALSFVWEEARAHQRWMAVLKMDPKNIVFSTTANIIRPTPYLSKQGEVSVSKLSVPAYDILIPQQVPRPGGDAIVNSPPGPVSQEERCPGLSPKARQLIAALPNLGFMRARELKMPVT